MKSQNNRIVVDLNKVQWAKFYWINQYGDRHIYEPGVFITVHGKTLTANEYAAYHPDYPCETTYERAKRLDIIDVWQPVCYLQLTANHSLTYTGKKAQDIWKAWQTRIFSKQKK